jgi:hypothetical protein
MKNVILVRTSDVKLAPAYDSDYNTLRAIPEGEILTVDLEMERNPRFHRKFFAMVKFFYEHMPEIITSKYPDPETFRRQFLFYYCGVTEEIIDWKGDRHIVPKSVSWGAMDNIEFREVYERIRDKIAREFFPDIENEELEAELLNFM